MSYVYLYEDPKTGIPRYIGKGTGNRAYAHLKSSHNHRLHNMIKKRAKEGFNPMPRILKNDISPLVACAVEIFWIAVFGRDDTGKGSLFNATDGGDGASGVKGKTQKAWNKGVKTGPNYALRGMKLAPSTIEKRTESRKARNNGEYSRPLSETARNNIKLSWEKRRMMYGNSGRKSS